MNPLAGQGRQVVTVPKLLELVPTIAVKHAFAAGALLAMFDTGSVAPPGRYAVSAPVHPHAVLYWPFCVNVPCTIERRDRRRRAPRFVE